MALASRITKMIAQLNSIENRFEVINATLDEELKTILNNHTSCINLAETYLCQLNASEWFIYLMSEFNPYSCMAGDYMDISFPERDDLMNGRTLCLEYYNFHQELIQNFNSKVKEVVILKRVIRETIRDLKWAFDHLQV